MKVTQRASAAGMLVFAIAIAIGVLVFISGTPLALLNPALAQKTTATNTTSPESSPEEQGGQAATMEEHAHESASTTSNETHQDTFTVRDSVFALLADQTIPASSFIHLYDTTPYSIRNGHVAAKIPCDDDSAPLLNILVGAAPEFTPAPMELVANLSSPGELCLYHVDLPTAPGPEQQQANTTTTATNTTTTANTSAIITDIAIQNPSDEDITLPSTSTVVIGINEIEKGAHGHEEGEEQATAP